MKTFLALIIGILIGVAVVWYYNEHRDNSRVREAGTEIEKAARSAGETIQQKMRDFNLNTSSITNELSRTGRVIREKAHDAGQALSDATADARVTAAIKAKLLRDSDLSAWNISVNTTEGVVTLSGTVSAPDDIGKAMLLALETEGARQVISTLQVKRRE